jgi:uncharacterized protein YjbI with pentapeptide repeats
MSGQRSPRKLGPAPPDLPPDLDPAPSRLESRARWECVQADGATEVGPRLADITLRESVWNYADLAGRYLSGFDCRDTRFERCDLSGAVLDGALLTRVAFTGCRMSGVVLSGATLQDVHLRECRADMANLRMARADFLVIEDSSLREAEFYQAAFARSALLGCDLHRANFQDCFMTDVDLHDSSLDDVRGALALRGASISPEQLVALAPSLVAAAGISVTAAARWKPR